MAHPATYIESASNPLIKDVLHAVSHSSPTRDGLWVAESFHLLDEALASKLKVREVLVSARSRAQAETHLRGHGDISLKVIDDALFQQIASTETTQGVLALVEPSKWELGDLFSGTPLVVVLDGVQDPGNAGAIVRCAEAFGAGGVIFLKGTAHVANPKTLRAAAGSLFRIPHVSGVEPEQLVEAAKARQLHVFAAMARSGRTLPEIPLNQGCVVVFGSEAHGVGEVFRNGADHVRVPTKVVESLNVSAAAAVVLYEAARQRAVRSYVPKSNVAKSYRPTSYVTKSYAPKNDGPKRYAAKSYVPKSGVATSDRAKRYGPKGYVAKSEAPKRYGAKGDAPRNDGMKRYTAKSYAPKSDVGTSDRAQSYGPKRYGPNRYGARDDAPKYGGPKRYAAKSYTPKSDVATSDRANSHGPKRYSPKSYVAKSDVGTSDRAQSYGPKRYGPKSYGARGDAPRNDGPKRYVAKSSAPRNGAPKGPNRGSRKPPLRNDPRTPRR